MKSYKSESGMSDVRLVFTILGAVFIPIIALVCFFVIKGISDYNADVAKQNAAVVAEQARIDADPISENNLYLAMNKRRTGIGAASLQTVPNLTTAASNYCKDMQQNKYFDYVNPTSKKDANSFITDSQGDKYYKYYVSSIMRGNKTTQTSSDVIAETMKNQAKNVADPRYNSVGWAICDDMTATDLAGGDNLLIVAAYAEVGEKPVAAAPVYVPQYVAPAPTYRAPTSLHCNTTEYQYIGGSSTSCYSY